MHAADGTSDAENKIKAAFIYNFLKFVEWPGDVGKYQICVLGDDNFLDMLQPITQRDVNGISIRVSSVNADNYATNNCHVLYVSASQATVAKSIITAIGEKPVLTVSDISNFTRLGGVIGFTKIDGKIRFELNNQQARTMNLRLSSKLQELATGGR